MQSQELDFYDVCGSFPAQDIQGFCDSRNYVGAGLGHVCPQPLTFMLKYKSVPSLEVGTP